MSCTNTISETEEVHFVNIISLAQDRLGSNFRILSNRIKGHDQILKDQEKYIQQLNQKTNSLFHQALSESNQNISMLQKQLQICLASIEQLRQKNTVQGEEIVKNSLGIVKNSEQIRDAKLMIQQGDKKGQNGIEEANKRINELRIELGKSYEMILKKQDSTQVLKLHQKLQKFNERSLKNEKDCSHLEHKIEKMQLLNQKVERLQMQKEFELMKDIDEKIKKSMKNLQKNAGIKGLNNFEIELKDQEPTNIQMQKNQKMNKINKNQTIEVLEHYGGQVDNSGLSILDQRMHNMETKIKSMEKMLTKMTQKNNGQKDMENGIKMLQKINEIKPQLIKIWAKCDTLDDKIAFNERKMQEKTKTIGSLVEIQKENNWVKLDEKIKAFQTQMYTSLKQIRSKMDNKVTNTEYEKYVMAMDERIRQINELIFLKSDKLEVKKALLFLQSKLKQIILVISEEEQNQKDVLLTKKQLKCMSCDKDIEKAPKAILSTNRDNWNAMPFKEHSPELLGKFGMTNFGSLSKRLKKLDSGDLPILNAKKNRNHWENRQNTCSDKKNQK